MIKKTNTNTLDEFNRITITTIKQNNKLKKFALNLSCKIQGKWYAVYRVDNYHGFLHEQKLWRSNQPLPLQEEKYISLMAAMKHHFLKISEEYEKYRWYFERSLE